MACVMCTASLFVACCNNAMKTPPSSHSNFESQLENGLLQVKQGIEIHGHRGARGRRPENSISGFEWAVLQGVDVLEMDLCISKDRHVVVSHEPWMNPEICSLPGRGVLNGGAQEKFCLLDMTVAEIQAFDCGSGGNPNFQEQLPIQACKPTLREVVEHCQRLGADHGLEIKYSLEIKYRDEWRGRFCPEASEFVSLVMSEIESLGIAKNSCIQSFSSLVMEEVNQQAQGMSTAWLVESMGPVEMQLAQLSFTPTIYSPQWNLLRQDDVRMLHQNGIRVIPWTVNDSTAMQKMIGMGVDGIISDYPDLLQRLLDEKASSNE